MNLISNLFCKNNLPNSLLLLGRDNQAKLQTIKDFIKSYYQDAGISGRIDNGTFLDVKILDKKLETIKIDDIRELIRYAHLSPIESNAKFIIIVDSEQMNLSASNSLLKILEEPSKHTYIFLLAENESSLIKTISSRCIKLHFKEENSLPKAEQDFLARTTVIKNDLKIFTDHYMKFYELIKNSKQSEIIAYVNSITSKASPKSWHHFTQSFLFLLSKLAAKNNNEEISEVDALAYHALYKIAIDQFANEQKLNLDKRILALTLIEKLILAKEKA